MTWIDLLWFPPLMLAVSIVVGCAGRRSGELASSVVRTFVALTIGIVTVGLAVHVLARLFA